ncbi:MAG: hypothetical protein PHX78_06145 [bacterium]|nr:hypothetical protein [bacterium]
MKKDNIPEALGILITLSSVVVMVGWFLNIGVLKSILPVWVSMKFPTALSFFLCGIELYFIARFRKKNRDLAVIIIPILSMSILLLMVSLLASTAIGINVGVEEMFVKDSTIAVGSVTPGRPSIVTMINFILIAMSGILTTMNIRSLNKLPAIFCGTAAITGLIAILGYSINLPLLYFDIPGKSSAMAIHTAILFVLFGAGIVLTERNK